MRRTKEQKEQLIKKIHHAMKEQRSYLVVG